MENAQCLISPNCPYPKINCYSCEYVIPKDLLLIEINTEIERLLTSIGKTNNKAILKRESHFLNHILFLLNESIRAFGKEHVDSILSLDRVKTKLLELTDKLVL